uniref:Ferredoxin oxidoreductase n=1 Tax=Eiseniibacteriota bacterium TaxID=2212470 RepID=A0A832MM26_UNCEI
MIPEGTAPLPLLRVSTPSGERYDGVVDLEKVRAAHHALHTQRESLIADGNYAAALATLQMWRCVLYPGFPITPSTKWIETVAAKIAEHQPNIKRVKLLEAEHAVADYLAGAAAACRDLVFATATSSVGLDHMTETTRSLGASGLGNVLLIDVYRATANYPLCIEGDPSDTLAHRDDGFIQIACRGKQQIYDTLLQAPCLGMHPDILTPVMPGYYGIKDSHRNARLTVEPDHEIHAFQDRWIRPCPLPGLINGDTAFGNCTTSRWFQGFKIGQKKRMERALEVLPQIGADFERTFGRPGLAYFDAVGFGDDAPPDVAVVTMGPDFGTFEALRPAFEARTGLRAAGLALRLLSPFPREAVRRKLAGARVVLVLNQAHHQGRGHLTLDVADALFPLDQRPRLLSAFAGLGGADVSEATWEAMLDDARAALDGPPPPAYRFYHEGRRL